MPADLAAYRTQDLSGVLAPLAAALLLLALIGPPVLARRLRQPPPDPGLGQPLTPPGDDR